MSTTETKTKKKRRKRKIVISIILLIVIVRLLMPWAITKYVNKVLAELDGYTGSIEDVDLSLYRGAYQIHGLDIKTVKEEIKSPFVAIKTIDLSVQWRALLDGALTGEIVVDQANLNFSATSEKGEVVTGEETDWTKTITDLMPLQINRFEVRESKISYIDDFVSPKVNIYFNNFNAIATNLSNSKDIETALPSHIEARSNTIGGGAFDANMNINILKKVPDFDLNASIEKVDVAALNDFLKAYAGIDAEKGRFDFYTEVALVDGKFDGYFKPLIKDMKVLKWSEEKEGFFGKSWEALVGLAGNILENKSKDQLGSRVPLSGSIEQTDVGVWPAIFSALKNAFIKPLQSEIETSVRVDSEGNVVEKQKKDKDKDDSKKKDKKFLGIF